MTTVKIVVPFLLLAACAPQHATIEEGQYIGFFSDGTSLSLARDLFDPQDPGFTAAYNFDCREFETPEERREMRLPDAIPCGQDIFPATHEVWTGSAGYRVVTESLEPWRAEVVIGGEGDLQLAFHHRLAGGGNMRFIFAVDPNFQPTTCEPTEDGGVEREVLDGDWIAEWSTELQKIRDSEDEEYRAAFAHMEPYLDDGRLFFLNSRSYQVNPRNIGDFWNLPDQYEAGAANAQMIDENMIQRRSVWGFPFVYSAADDSQATEDQSPFENTDLWFCEFDENDVPATAPCRGDSPWADMAALEGEVTATADETATELTRAFRPVNGEDPVFRYRPLTHMNLWRNPDGIPSGFDGWGEMHYNYVVFSADSDLSVGGYAEGAFSLAFEAIESTSQLFVTGRFVVDRIRRDRWATQDLREVKAEENGVELCFQQ